MDQPPGTHWIRPGNSPLGRLQDLVGPPVWGVPTGDCPVGSPTWALGGRPTVGVPGAPNGNQGLGPRPGHKRLRKDPQLGHQAGKLFGNLWGPLEGPPGRPGASRLGSPGLLDSRAWPKARPSGRHLDANQISSQTQRQSHRTLRTRTFTKTKTSTWVRAPKSGPNNTEPGVWTKQSRMMILLLDCWLKEYV